MTERGEGHSKLVYNKETRTIDKVDPHPPVPLPEGMETTPSEWAAELDNASLCRDDEELLIDPGWFEALLRDLDRALAEIARLTEARAEAEGDGWRHGYKEGATDKRIEMEAVANAREAAVRPADGWRPTQEHIKHMVDRFLSWQLPSPWHPDGGISFEPFGNRGTPHQFERHPSGTNLFDASQAEAMVRHMIDGLPSPPAEEETA